MDAKQEHVPAKIKFALELSEQTQVSIARACSVKPTTVGAVIHGRSRSKRIELTIARVTGLSRHELWPQWYGPNDKPIRRPRHHPTRLDTLMRLQRLNQIKREAA